MMSSYDRLHDNMNQAIEKDDPICARVILNFALIDFMSSLGFRLNNEPTNDLKLFVRRSRTKALDRSYLMDDDMGFGLGVVVHNNKYDEHESLAVVHVDDYFPHLDSKVEILSRRGDGIFETVNSDTLTNLLDPYLARKHSPRHRIFRRAVNFLAAKA